MRIGIVNPNTSQSMTESVVRAAGQTAHGDTVLVPVTSGAGVPSVESFTDEAVATVNLLKQLDDAERSPQAPDAYVIACFGDTGVAAARERAAGPVVGMTEAALSTAAVIAYRFTVITMPPRTVAMAERVVQALGLGHRCVVRAIDEPVAAVTEGSLHLVDEFLAAARRAIAEDAAEAIVLGCAGLADLREPLADALGLPVIDGVQAGVAVAEGLVAQRLRTSQANTWRRLPGVTL